MNDRDLVSASKIGKMAWCPHGGSLQEQGASRVFRAGLKLNTVQQATSD